MISQRWFKFICLLAFGFMLLSACGGESPGGGAYVWIDVPMDGLSFPDVQAIKIEGHAASPGGVSRVEIWVNGTSLATINDPPADGELALFFTEWTPSETGEYVIQAVAFGLDGAASEPDTTRVTFGNETPVPSITETATPVITVIPVVTETPTTVPGADIQFWAEPLEIQAGACTTIYWHVENVQSLVFGGIDQPFDGSYKDCLCENQRYTLTVTLQNGTQEKRTVDINVTGTCVTPTAPPPPQDNTPPPAPQPAVPDNGLTLSCRASQSLVWLPVDDPSGIQYQVEVQRHSGNNNWQAVSGSIFTVADKTLSVPVECGWYYRWRVRAVDGVGNISLWSGWWQFTITLT